MAGCKQLRPEEGTPGGAVPFEAVVIRPASAQGPCPGIVLPHGGPHSAYVRSYMLPTAFLPALGYAIIAVRGLQLRDTHLGRPPLLRNQSKDSQGILN